MTVRWKRAMTPPCPAGKGIASVPAPPPSARSSKVRQMLMERAVLTWAITIWNVSGPVAWIIVE